MQRTLLPDCFRRVQTAETRRVFCSSVQHGPKRMHGTHRRTEENGKIVRPGVCGRCRKEAKNTSPEPTPLSPFAPGILTKRVHFGAQFSKRGPTSARPFPLCILTKRVQFGKGTIYSRELAQSAGPVAGFLSRGWGMFSPRGLCPARGEVGGNPVKWPVSGGQVLRKWCFPYRSKISPKNFFLRGAVAI